MFEEFDFVLGLVEMLADFEIFSDRKPDQAEQVQAETATVKAEFQPPVLEIVKRD